MTEKRFVGLSDEILVNVYFSGQMVLWPYAQTFFFACQHLCISESNYLVLLVKFMLGEGMRLFWNYVNSLMRMFASEITCI